MPQAGNTSPRKTNYLLYIVLIVLVVGGVGGYFLWQSHRAAQEAGEGMLENARMMEKASRMNAP